MSEDVDGDIDIEVDPSTLRRGWTTGACATAATKAAFIALLTGEFPDPVTITLPRGETPSFALAVQERGEEGWARAGIVKDAGDDPDVTHGAVVVSTVRRGAAGAGVEFVAGEGVGTVTKPGLPIEPGEPAINPVPRRMMREVIEEVATANGVATDVVVELSIPDGEAIAAQTWNPRLGIVGGLSILGTTGIVVPYSCSAWIASIHQGVDVARAAGLAHVAGCTGSTSEEAVQAHLGLPETAMLDMGDFAGALLKYLARHPVDRLTIGGGFAKLSKLAIGHLDLHSGRSQVDLDDLARRLEAGGAGTGDVERARDANSALEVLAIADGLGIDLATPVATDAQRVAAGVLDGAPIDVDVLVVDRAGKIIGSSPGSKT